MEASADSIRARSSSLQEAVEKSAVSRLLLAPVKAAWGRREAFGGEVLVGQLLDRYLSVT